MGKIIQKYRAFTPTEMKARASIPIQADIVVNADNIDCSRISLNSVKNLIGEATYSLGNLCTDNAINKWSAFSPYIRTLDGAQGQTANIVHSLPASAYSLGSFAGYNHNAIAPSYLTTINDVQNSAGGDVTITCQLVLGELKIVGGDIVGTGIQGIAFTVWDGGLLKGNQVRSLASIKNHCRTVDGTDFSVTFAGPGSGDKIYQCKLYFITSSTTYDMGNNEVCKVFTTELPQFTKTIHVPVANSVLITGNRTPTFGSGLSTNLTTGYIAASGLTVSAVCNTSLVVKAWVEDYKGTKLTDDYYLRNAAAGPYTPANSNVLTQRATTWSTPGSLNNPALSRMIWTNGGVARSLPMSSYDLVWRIDFAGT